MDALKQVEQFKEFFDGYYKEKIMYNISKDKHYIYISFPELMGFDPFLGYQLLDDAEETIKAAEISAESLEYINVKDFKVRFYNLKESTPPISSWEVRSEDVGKFVSVVGNITMLSGVLHVMASATFECPACGNTINVLMTNGIYKEPQKCGCGRKTGFRTIGNGEIVDTIKIHLSDDLLEDKNKNRNIARKKVAILEHDLTHKDTDSEIRAGRKVVINGYLKYIQRDMKSATMDSILMVNSVEFIKIGWDQVKVTEKEEEEIVRLSKEPDIIERLADSISDVQGYEAIKTSLILQLVGAPDIYDKNKELASRGTIHVLLAGDPGGAKTYLAKRAGVISPIYQFTSAANASGKGLVVSLYNDKELGEWSCVPGVVVLCHKGIVVIDEVDKTNVEDFGDHNNAMNDMKVRVDKATVHAQLDASTSYLATANPKHRVFTDFGTYLEQINMPKDWLDRFDLIFAILPSREQKKMEKVVGVMVDRRIDDEDNDSTWKPEFTHDFIRKYIASCRKAFQRPKFSKELKSKITERLFQLMKPKTEESQASLDPKKEIPESQAKISYRHLESIMRLADASSRLRRTDVDEEAIDLAFKLKYESFKSLKVIDEEGNYNWDVEEKVDKKEINKYQTVKEAMKRAEKEEGKQFSIDTVVKICSAQDIEMDEVEEVIEKMKKHGECFEPKRGQIVWL